MSETTNKIYGLLGARLGHSFSPAIHHMLGNEDYALYELPEQDLEAFLRQEDFGGVNVTIPYKQAVLPFVDECSDAVRTIGAANTIVRKGGKLFAENTDVPGFVYMVRKAGIDIARKTVLVLGTGGASKAVCEALRQLSAGEVRVVSRSKTPDTLTYEELDDQTDIDVLVNTTPVGMYPNNLETPVDLSRFPNLSGVLDVIYNPLRTGLLLQAEAMDLPCANGLSMLSAQAVRAHEIFFDTFVEDMVIETILGTLTKDAENLVLIGMPGSGKSTVAKLLSEQTGRDVVELDECIAAAAGKTIPEIFAEDGEAAFRELESEQIRLAGAKTGQILSLGGGAVTRPENYLPLHQNGRIYRLTRDLGSLATDGRPLSKDLDTLRAMEAVRAPLYEQFADVIVPNDSAPEEAAEAILQEFEKHS